MEAEFAYDVADPAGFPSDGLPEVAVLGRSNVGKSSAINALLARRSLARTSASPGKTRRIHFYRLGAAAYLVDLPGFGYARVPKSEREAWRSLVEAYLRGERRELRGCILLVDLRRGPEDEERDLLAWLAEERIPARIALTKSDKLTRSETARRVPEIARLLGLSMEELAVISSKTGAGLHHPARWIQEWTGLELRRADGGRFT